MCGYQDTRLSWGLRKSMIPVGAQEEQTARNELSPTERQETERSSGTERSFKS